MGCRKRWDHFLSRTKQPPPLFGWKPTLSLSPPGVLPEGRYDCRNIFKNGQRSPNFPTAFHSFYSTLDSNPLSLYLLRENPPQQQPQCSSSVSSPLSWLSVSNISSDRFNPWPLTSLIASAAASTLAGPIPADSLLAREPEIVGAREPSPGCAGRNCV